MIQRRLEDRSWLEEKEIWPEERGGGDYGRRRSAWVNSSRMKIRKHKEERKVYPVIYNDPCLVVYNSVF